MTTERHKLLLDVQRLDRYTEYGMGVTRDNLGEWLRRSDVLALIEGLDVLRDGTTKGGKA